MLNALDLFTGIGGITLALRDYVNPIAYCEIDPYCQSVLLSRMQENDLPQAPIWDDIRTLPIGELPDIDIIYGGFPCQDISCAGTGKGLEGERSGLFFEIVRLSKEIQPSFIFLENVPAITTRGGLRVVREIAEMGYDCRWCTISASSVGALHRRERWFLLAHSNRKNVEGQRTISFRVEKEYCTINKNGQNVANSNDTRSGTSTHDNKKLPQIIEKWNDSQHRSCRSSKDDCDSDSLSSEQTYQRAKPKHENKKAWREHSGQHWPFKSRNDWQEIVSEMGKCSDGIPYHVDRLKALGNSVVPMQVQKAFEFLMGII